MAVAALAAVCLVSLAAAAAIVLLPKDDKIEGRGVWTLVDDSDEPDTEGGVTDCSGTGGYEDFEAGADVTIRDADGKIVGAATMRNPASRSEFIEYMVASGEADDEANAKELADFVDDEDYACVLITDFDVKQSDFYEFSLGRRGEISMSKKEFENKDHMFVFSLG